MCREVEVTEAEVGEMQPQAKVCPKLGEAGRGGGCFSPGASGENGPGDMLRLDFWPLEL